MKVTSIIAAAAIALSGSVASASTVNLLNGSFEDAFSGAGDRGHQFQNLNNKGGSWDVWKNVPGWRSTKGAGIEIQSNRTLRGIDAHSGQHYVELDSHNNSNMKQTLSLTKGTYELSFWYAPRTKSSDTNDIKFKIADLAETIAGPDQQYPRLQWTQIKRKFHVDQDGDFDLVFKAKGRNDSYGGLLDTIEVSAVPLPASAFLLLAGVGALGAMKRRKKA